MRRGKLSTDSIETSGMLPSLRVTPSGGKVSNRRFPTFLSKALIWSARTRRSVQTVDHVGTTVVVGKGSAYDLFLTRTLANATIVRAPTSAAVVDLFVSESLDVAAGVRQQLQADADRFSGLRLLDGRFMVIGQAMGTPKGRAAGAAFVAAFLSTMVESGFIARSLAANHVKGAVVARAASSAANE
jgi:polar amino acid transport system substrate-binding protein